MKTYLLIGIISSVLSGAFIQYLYDSKHIQSCRYVHRIDSTQTETFFLVACQDIPAAHLREALNASR